MLRSWLTSPQAQGGFDMHLPDEIQRILQSHSESLMSSTFGDYIVAGGLGIAGEATRVQAGVDWIMRNTDTPNGDEIRYWYIATENTVPSGAEVGFAVTLWTQEPASSERFFGAVLDIIPVYISDPPFGTVYKVELLWWASAGSTEMDSTARTQLPPMGYRFFWGSGGVVPSKFWVQANFEGAQKISKPRRRPTHTGLVPYVRSMFPHERIAADC